MYDDDDDYSYGADQSSGYVRTSASRKAIGCVGCLPRFLFFVLALPAFGIFVGLLLKPGGAKLTNTWIVGGLFLIYAVLWWASIRFFGEHARRQSVVDEERWRLEAADQYSQDEALRQKAQRAFAKRQARRKP